MITEFITPFLSEILIGVVLGAISAALKMWRDVHILKRDVDAIAEIVGTVRALARKKRKAKK